jgi:hypothetical protein
LIKECSKSAEALCILVTKKTGLAAFPELREASPRRKRGRGRADELENALSKADYWVPEKAFSSSKLRDDHG